MSTIEGTTSDTTTNATSDATVELNTKASHKARNIIGANIFGMMFSITITFMFLFLIAAVIKEQTLQQSDIIIISIGLAFAMLAFAGVVLPLCIADIIKGVFLMRLALEDEHEALKQQRMRIQAEADLSADGEDYQEPTDA